MSIAPYMISTEVNFCCFQGALPTLELYATMQRNMEENKFVMEHSIDGMELCVAAFFRSLPNSAHAHS